MRRRISEFEIRARLSIELECVNEVELKSFALTSMTFLSSINRANMPLDIPQPAQNADEMLSSSPFPQLMRV